MIEHLKISTRWALGASIALFMQGCAVIAVADAAVTVVATGVKITAKGVGAVAGVLIPDKEKEK